MSFAYNVTISSASPAIQYYPSRDGPISEGWNASYSKSRDDTYQRMQLAQGYAIRRTAAANAYFELEWFGTAAYVYGYTDPSTRYNISVDDTIVPSNADLPNNLLGYTLGLKAGPHRLKVQTLDSQPFSVLGTVLTLDVGVEA